MEEHIDALVRRIDHNSYEDFLFAVRTMIPSEVYTHLQENDGELVYSAGFVDDRNGVHNFELCERDADSFNRESSEMARVFEEDYRLAQEEDVPNGLVEYGGTVWVDTDYGLITSYFRPSIILDEGQDYSDLPENEYLAAHRNSYDEWLGVVSLATGDENVLRIGSPGPTGALLLIARHGNRKDMVRLPGRLVEDEYGTDRIEKDLPLYHITQSGYDPLLPGFLAQPLNMT